MDGRSGSSWLSGHLTFLTANRLSYRKHGKKGFWVFPRISLSDPFVLGKFRRVEVRGQGVNRFATFPMNTRYSDSTLGYF